MAESQSQFQSCPVCNQLIRGNLDLFEAHVNSHFYDEEHSILDEVHSPSIINSPDSDFPDHLLSPEFDVECDAPGCDMKVNIGDMAVHMDRHLAEQIHSRETAENIASKLNENGYAHGKGKGKSTINQSELLNKRARVPSPEMSSCYDDEEVQHSLAVQYIDDEDDDNIPVKKPRSRSPDVIKSSSKKPEESTKQSGQTTMDGFFKKAFGAITSSSSTSNTSTSPSSPKKPTFGSSKPNSKSLNDSSGTPGLIPKARILLNASIVQGVTRQAYLADPSIKFVQSDGSDKGWGCGYRNTQMMLSYVVSQPTTQKDIPQGANRNSIMGPVTSPIPNIKELQQQLEFAWKSGYDPTGAKQLNYKVSGTKQWIGTTEVWAILSSLGIRCSILDFHVPTGPNGTHPAMLAAIYNYFRTPAWAPLESPPFLKFKGFEQKAADQRVIQTAKPPIYIQHQGHSRTIIGVEVLENGELNLLTFDPGRWLHSAIPSLKEEMLSKLWEPSHGSKIRTANGLLDTQYLLKAFRLPPAVGLSKSQYQLLGISGLYVERNSATTGSPQIRKNRLELLKKPTSLSIGWNEVEAGESKLVASTRVP
ncbi:hypothetical protein BGZ76_010666 [Entomortierella beljakovae]|nr:hypothetical protein BGZ76_010666 [Entomortierella beljakovae]